MPTQHIIKGVVADSLAPIVTPSYASSTIGRWLASEAITSGNDITSIPNMIDQGNGDLTSSPSNAQIVNYRNAPAALFAGNNYFESSIGIPLGDYSKILFLEFATASIRQIWGSDTNTAGEYNLLNINAAGEIRVYHQGAERASSSAVSIGSPISLVQTCQILGSDAIISVYANAVKILDSVQTVPNLDNTSRIGFFTTSANGFDGHIWDIQLTNKALNMAEIKMINSYHQQLIS